jgi:hypothetical protein
MANEPWLQPPKRGLGNPYRPSARLRCTARPKAQGAAAAAPERAAAAHAVCVGAMCWTPRRVAFHAVWHTTPCGIPRRVAYHAVWHTTPCGIPRRVAYHAVRGKCEERVLCLSEPGCIRLTNLDASPCTWCRWTPLMTTCDQMRRVGRLPSNYPQGVLYSGT